MPIEKINPLVAIKNENHSYAVWPSKRSDPRMEPFVGPHFQPTFQIESEDKIFCMGSCFARNIELALMQLGFDCVSGRAINPYATSWGGNNFLIRYNPFSMLNEFTWALDPNTPFPEEAFLPVDDLLWSDPHNHVHYEAHPFNRLKEMRKIVHENTRQVRSCRIIILTLGLVEAWFDHKIGRYTNIMPDTKMMQNHPERFSLNVLDINEVLQALDGMYQLLIQYGHPNFRLLISVSPVPLHLTFRNQDVFSANTYSKSVLRCAVEEFCLLHENVDYFPSYESIMLSEKKSVWCKDQRHVTSEVVRFNVSRMICKYISPNVLNYKTLIIPFKKRRDSLVYFHSKIGSVARRLQRLFSVKK